jgi:hypothetical protein
VRRSSASRRENPSPGSVRPLPRLQTKFRGCGWHSPTRERLLDRGL